MKASSHGSDTIVQILLTFGASPNSADLDGNTPLHFASAYGHLLPLRTLLAAHANPMQRNSFAWTPVSYSLTVQAEVYFKNLIAEVERRRAILREREQLVAGSGGGGVGE